MKKEVPDEEGEVQTGEEVLKKTRSSVATVGLPITIIPASPDPEADFSLMKAGADDGIRYPFDSRRFMTRVKAVLRGTAV